MVQPSTSEPAPELTVARADVWAACLQSSLLLSVLALGVRLAVPGLNSQLLHTNPSAVAGLLAGDLQRLG